MKPLLIVDLQNDFCENGSLAVKSSLNIIPVINQYISLFAEHKYPVIASRDWHPETTPHFKSYGGIWPAHCVRNTPGAAFHPDLNLPENAIVVSKGTGNEDGFSAFEAIDRNSLSLEALLKRLKVSELYICGLATDYCVKNTVLDALKSGYKVYLLADAVKGVELMPGDSEKAIQEMLECGADSLTLGQIKNFKKLI